MDVISGRMALGAAVMGHCLFLYEDGVRGTFDCLITIVTPNRSAAIKQAPAPSSKRLTLSHPR